MASVATASAPASAPRSPLAKITPVSLPPLRVATWQINPKYRPWRWVVHTMPFREAITIFRPREYDFVANVGEQRPKIEAWVSRLRRIMDDDDFAPAMWSACLRPAQLTKVEWHNDGTITINTGTTPIALIDGNHRGQAMLKYYAIAEKKGDTVAMELLDKCDISIQIYLEPDRARKTFRALQEGKKVSPDLLALQKLRDDDVSPQSDLAFKAAMSLNGNKDSHLAGKIGTGGTVTNMIGIKTAMTDSSSELSCSILGGANIAVEFKKDPDWLEKCYVEAWDAVQHATDQSGEFMGRAMASCLMAGKVLCPLGWVGGKKGGTTLISGICNMWAYMKAVKAVKEMGDGERNYLAGCVDQVFNFVNDGGLNAPQKRTLMGRFAGAYFQPIVLNEGEKPKAGKVAAASNGVPLPLYNHLMSPSAFGPKKGAVSLPSENSLVDEYEDADDDETAADGGNVAVRGRNKPALAKIHEA